MRARLFVAREVRAAGPVEITGVSLRRVLRAAMNRGLAELRREEPQGSSRIRRRGYGRKPKIENDLDCSCRCGAISVPTGSVGGAYSLSNGAISSTLSKLAAAAWVGPQRTPALKNSFRRTELNCEPTDYESGDHHRTKNPPDPNWPLCPSAGHGISAVWWFINRVANVRLGFGSYIESACRSCTLVATARQVR
jgi:hypothetical protein